MPITAQLDNAQLDTPRLILRSWQEQDYPIFAAINADSDVMEFFPTTLSAEESNQLANKLSKQLTEHGWGRWAVARKSDNLFVGFVGLQRELSMPFGECVEISWRLGHSHWGHGYGAEAATEALRFGFGKLGLKKIVSFTAVANSRSQALMKRLGMEYTGYNFSHPKLPDDHSLSEHVLYETNRQQFMERLRRAN